MYKRQVPYRAELAGDEHHHNENILYTQAQRKAYIDAWGKDGVIMFDRAQGYLFDLRDLVARIVGDLPVHDDQGVELTGADALNHRLYTLYQVNLRSFAGQTYQTWFERFRNATKYDISPDVIAPDVKVAREQYMERLQDAVDARIAWLFDGDTNPANALQVAAQQLLAAKLQEGKRSFRTCTTLQSLASAWQTLKTQVEDVNVEGKPIWQTGTGSVISGKTHSVTYTEPVDAEDSWSVGLRVVHPSETISGISKADLGNIVLDIPEPPEGWVVVAAPRKAPNNHEIDVAISWSGDEAPAEGSYILELTARHAGGPAMLQVKITVPA